MYFHIYTFPCVLRSLLYATMGTGGLLFLKSLHIYTLPCLLRSLLYATTSTGDLLFLKSRPRASTSIERSGPNLKPGTVCVCGIRGLRNGRNTTQHPPSPASRAGTDPPTNVQAVLRAFCYANTHRPRFQIRARPSYPPLCASQPALCHDKHRRSSLLKEPRACFGGFRHGQAHPEVRVRLDGHTDGRRSESTSIGSSRSSSRSSSTIY